MAKPRAGEEELQDREETSSPPCCRDYHGLRSRIQERLRRAVASFNDRRLEQHLERMPPRYLADVDADDKADDVLLHWGILDECADPDKRPVFHARYLKSIKVRAGQPCPRLAEGFTSERNTVEDDSDSRITSSRHRVIPLHEIIFCSVDRPRLLCRLSSLVEEVGLHILEGHLYCTVDGFCLALFLVNGWETEETHGLLDQIKETLAQKNQSISPNSPTFEKILDLQQELEILQLTGANANKGESVASSVGPSGQQKETEVSEDAEMAGERS